MMARDATNNVARNIRCTIVLASRGKSSWAANEAVACLLSFLALEAQLIVA